MAGEYSNTRLYLGNLHKDARKQEVEEFFKEHGHGNIVEVKLMNGFGFIQYDNEDDAKDIVPAYHGREFKGQALTVQFARGSRRDHRDTFQATGDRGYPRPRRTAFRMNITGLQPDTSWQDLKDFARRSNVDVVFSEVSRERDGRGMVEFESYDDLRHAVNKLDNTEFKGVRVNCVADVSATAPSANAKPNPSQDREPPHGSWGSSHRHRSRSPYRRGYSPPPARGHHSPPRRRDYTPPRYRERSPIRGSGREPYYSSSGSARDRSPPPRRPLPPPEDYPPPRSGYNARDDYPPSRRGGYEDDTYPAAGANGSGRRGGGYDDAPPRGRPTSPPPRGRSPPPPRGGPSGRGGYDDYDRRRY
ncbi:hypothetical protein RUND412_003999 [Rhizina undulata]